MKLASYKLYKETDDVKFIYADLRKVVVTVATKIWVPNFQYTDQYNFPYISTNFLFW